MGIIFFVPETAYHRNEVYDSDADNSLKGVAAVNEAADELEKSGTPKPSGSIEHVEHGRTGSTTYLPAKTFWQGESSLLILAFPLLHHNLFCTFPLDTGGDQSLASCMADSFVCRRACPHLELPRQERSPQDHPRTFPLLPVSCCNLCIPRLRSDDLLARSSLVSPARPTFEDLLLDMIADLSYRPQHLLLHHFCCSSLPL